MGPGRPLTPEEYAHHHELPREDAVDDTVAVE